MPENTPVPPSAGSLPFSGQFALPFELMMPEAITPEGSGPLSELRRRLLAATDPTERELLRFQWETLRFAGGYSTTLPTLPAGPTAPPVLPVTPSVPAQATPDRGWADFSLHDLINTTESDHSFARIAALTSPPQVTPSLDELRAGFVRNKYYINEPNLLTVETSIRTGMPIIVEGPPGTGKTSLAEQITRAIGLDPKNPNHLIEIFCTPDISKDSVLYSWHDSRRLMDLQTLQAVAQFLPPAKLRELYLDLTREAFSLRYLIIHRLLKAVLLNYRCVVLIDEIDKAYPEWDTVLFDILERSSYVIPEIGRLGNSKPPGARPLFVITSNAQRELASPLRRRANYIFMSHLNEVTEAEVLVAKVGVTQAQAQTAAMFFREMREHRTFRPGHLPSTAEAIYTVRTLHDSHTPITRRNLLRSHGLWLKGKDDFDIFHRVFGDELKSAMSTAAAA